MARSVTYLDSVDRAPRCRDCKSYDVVQTGPGSAMFGASWQCTFCGSTSVNKWSSPPVDDVVCKLCYTEDITISVSASRMNCQCNICPWNQEIPWGPSR